MMPAMTPHRHARSSRSHELWICRRHGGAKERSPLEWSQRRTLTPRRRPSKQKGHILTYCQNIILCHQRGRPARREKRKAVAIAAPSSGARVAHNKKLWRGNDGGGCALAAMPNRHGRLNRLADGGHCRGCRGGTRPFSATTDQAHRSVHGRRRL